MHGLKPLPSTWAIKKNITKYLSTIYQVPEQKGFNWQAFQSINDRISSGCWTSTQQFLLFFENDNTAT